MVRKEKKPEIVDRMTDRLNRAEIAIVTDYRGLTVSQITELRRKFREQGIEYHVVKNTLATFAADNAGKHRLSEFLKGPTAIAFGYDDVIQPAKVLVDFQKAVDSTLNIKGGLLAGNVLTSADVVALAKLPSREELIGKVVGLMQSPIYGLVTVLNGNLRGLVGVLQARVNQMEEQGG